MRATAARTLRPVAVLDLARGDLLERDLEVVLRVRLDHRRRVLVEGPLAEVVVVRVDLPRPLGGHDHCRIVGVDLLEQLVEAWLDHFWGAPLLVGGSTIVAASRSSSATALSRSSLTITCLNSLRAVSSSSALARRLRICSSESVPRPWRRSLSAS